MAQREEKKPLFTISRLIMALVFFAAFLVIGIGGYYTSVGEFVSEQMAGIYVVLALIGAVGVFFRLRWFTFLFYSGCGIGWIAGWYISGLKGAFAPTAGNICTVFLIAVFTLVGVLEQIRSFQKRRERRIQAEARRAAQEEEEKKQAELAAARKAREEAEAALVQAAGSAAPAVEEPAPQPAAEPPVKEEPEKS